MSKKIVNVLALAIILHVVLCVYLTVAPRSYLATRMVGVLYKKFFVVGPFFSEDRIQSSPHTRIRYYTSRDGWQTLTAFGEENFRHYQEQPWRFDKLKRRDFEYRLFRLAYGTPRSAASELIQQEPFRQADTYIAKELLPDMAVDSLHILYFTSTWRPNIQILQYDTVTDFTYSPADISR